MKKLSRILIAIFLVSMVLLTLTACKPDCKGEHSWDDGVTVSEATCTEDGEKLLTCTKCKETSTVAIPKLGHTFSMTPADVVAGTATCTEAGTVDHYHCSRCNKDFDLQGNALANVNAAALGHKWNSGEITKAATCAQKGVKTFTCSVCGDTKTEEVAVDPSNHVYGEIKSTDMDCSTNTEGMAPHYECACGKLFDADKHETTREELVIPVTHEWDEGEVTTAATCVEKGVKTFTCATCGTTKTEDLPIDPANHVFGELKSVAMNCKEGTDGVAPHYECACGKIFDEDKQETTLEALAVPAMHTWNSGEITKESTCVETGLAVFTCTVCGTEDSRELPMDPGNHVYGDLLYTKMDCVTNTPGVAHHYECECGKYFDAYKTETTLEDLVIPVAHTWSEGEVSKVPTCVDTGLKSAVCEICGTEDEAVELPIDPNNHVYGELIPEVDPVCATKTPGVEAHYECECGKLFDADKKETVASALSIMARHSWDGGEVVSVSTCSEHGEIAYVCLVCGQPDSDPLPLDPNNHVYGALKSTAMDCGQGLSGYLPHYDCTCGKVFDEDKNETTREAMVIPVAHTWGEGEQTRAPGCETTGQNTFHCLECGTVKNETIPALGHKVRFVNNGVSSCKVQGEKAHWACSVCSKWFEDEDCKEPIEDKSEWRLPLGNHSFGSWSQFASATCTKAEELTHKCLVCGEEEHKEGAPAMGHNFFVDGELDTSKWIPATTTCEVAGQKAHYHCGRCGNDFEADGKTQILNLGQNALGHKYADDDWKQKSEADCLNAEVLAHNCSVCGKEQTKDGAPKLGHTFQDAANNYALKTELWINLAPTCEDEGIVGHYHCDRCETNYGAQGIRVIENIVQPARGHSTKFVEDDYANLTCITATAKAHWVCSTCNNWFEDEAAKTRIENKSAWVLPLADHTWDNGKVTRAPTCTATGVKTYTCQIEDCDETRVVTIRAKGHTFQEYDESDKLVVKEDALISATEATCTQAARIAHYFCDTCKHYYSETLADLGIGTGNITVGTALGHSWNEGEITKVPTCIVTGVKTFTCTRSGCNSNDGKPATRTEILPVDMTNHVYTEDDFHAAVAMDCSKDIAGMKAYYEGHCGLLFDEEGNEVNEEDLIIPVKHTPVEVIRLEPTCTEDGHIAHYDCEVCERHFRTNLCIVELDDEDVLIPAIGHDWNTSGYVRDDTGHWYSCDNEGCTAKNSFVSHEDILYCADCGWISSKAGVRLKQGVNITFYETIAEALENVTQNYSVVFLVRDYEDDGFTYNLPGITCDLDLNKHTYTVNGPIVLEKGTMPIVDGNITLGENAYIVNNGANSVISDVTLVNNATNGVGLIARGGITLLARTTNITATTAIRLTYVPENGKLKVAERDGEVPVTGNVEFGYESDTPLEDGWNNNIVYGFQLKDRTILTKDLTGEGHSWSWPYATFLGLLHIGEEHFHHWDNDSWAPVNNDEYHYHVCDDPTCNEVISNDESARALHEWLVPEGTVVRPATCTANGLKRYACSVCGYIKEEAIPAVGHSLTFVPATEATCTKPATLDHYYCSVCDKNFSDADGKLAMSSINNGTTLALHTYVAIGEAVEPTCEDWGITAGEVCSVCGYVNKAQENLKPLGHAAVRDARVEPTCTTTGLTAGWHCTRCSAKLAQQVIPKRGHSFEDFNDNYKVNELALIPAVNLDCTQPGTLAHYYCYDCGHYFTENRVEGVLVSLNDLGQDESLLVTASTNHALVPHAEVAPTCTKDGNTAYESCSACGKIFTRDATDPDKLIEKNASDVIIPATGHTFSVWTVVADSTCTQAGTRTRTCTNEWCVDGENGGKFVETDNISKKPHTEEALGEKAPTCTATGLTAGTKCSVCNEILKAQEVVAALGHNEETDAAVPATCTKTGLTEGSTCSRCGTVLVAQQSVPALGHDWDEGTVTQELSCTMDEQKLFSCQRSGCDATETRTTQLAQGHKAEEEEEEEEEATCLREGTAAHWKCAECGLLFSDEECTNQVSAESLVIPRLGHTFQDAANGYALIGSPTEKAATCTQTGLAKHYYCTRCETYYGEFGIVKKTLEDITTPALNHIFAGGTVTTAPTCTEEGVRTFTCKREGCTDEGEDNNGHTRVWTQAEPALGHSWATEFTVDLEATCSTAGSKSKHCTRDGCDAKTEITVIQRTGHSFEVWDSNTNAYTVDTSKKLSTPATCTTAGESDHYYCTKCESTFGPLGKVKVTDLTTLVIPALGHSATHTEAKASTCTAQGNVEYWYCSRCEKYYSDEDCTTLIGTGTLSDVKLPLGSHKLQHHEAAVATVYENGCIEHWQCTVCNKYFADATATKELTYTQVTIPKLDKHPLTAVPAKDATCTEDGNIAYWHCPNCDEYFLDADGNQQTTLADVTIAKGHVYDNGAITTPATCVTEGVKTFTCTRTSCHEGDAGHSYTEPVAKDSNNHVLGELKQTAMSCEGEGTVGYLPHYDCACGKTFDTNLTLVMDHRELEIPVEHHLDVVSAAAPTCITEGNQAYWYCDNCHRYFKTAELSTSEVWESKPTIAALGHNFTDVGELLPTCTDDGHIAYKECTRTHNKYAADAATNAPDSARLTDAQLVPAAYKATGHTPVEHLANDPTCTEDGNIQYWTCSKCNKYFLDEACTTEATSADQVKRAATGHNMEEHTANAATCLTDGNVQYWHCTKCNKNFSEGGKSTTKEIAAGAEVLSALGHNFTAEANHKAAKDATCLNDGNVEYWHCSRCNQNFGTSNVKDDSPLSSVTIAALGHDFTAADAHVAAVQPTCTTDGNREYWHCARCEKNFASSATNNAESITNITPDNYKKTGHTLSRHDAVPATCTANGTVEYWSCSKCNKNFADNVAYTTNEITNLVTDLVDHNLSEHTATAATCAQDGNSAYWTCSVCNKYFSDAAGATETTAEDVVIPATGEHVFAAETQTCSVCGQINPNYLKAEQNGVVLKLEPSNFSTVSYNANNKAHKIDGYTVTTNQIMQQSSLMQWKGGEGYLTVSGDFSKIIINDTAGSFTVTKHTSADCSDTGSKVEPIKGEYTLSEGTNNIKIAVGSATGKVTSIEFYGTVTHSTATNTATEGKVKVTPATCGTDGAVEFLCDLATCTEWHSVAISATGAHSTTQVGANPKDCTTDGNVEYWHCSKCNQNFKDKACTEVWDDVVIPAGHDWDEGTVTTPATCGTAGEKTATCLVCGTTDTVVIPATGEHVFADGAVLCSNCNIGAVNPAYLTKVDNDNILATFDLRDSSNTSNISKTWSNLTETSGSYTCTINETTKVYGKHANGIRIGTNDAASSLSINIAGTGVKKLILTVACYNAYTVTITFDKGTVLSVNGVVPSNNKQAVLTSTSYVKIVLDVTGETKIKLSADKRSYWMSNVEFAGDPVTYQSTTNVLTEGSLEYLAPTCDAAGYVRFKCADCTDWHTTELAQTSHNWLAATCEAPKTCSVCGATDGPALGHDLATDWTLDETGHWHTCANNAEEQIDFASHAGLQHCTTCGWYAETAKVSLTTDNSNYTYYPTIAAALADVEDSTLTTLALVQEVSEAGFTVAANKNVVINLANDLTITSGSIINNGNLTITGGDVNGTTEDALIINNGVMKLSGTYLADADNEVLVSLRAGELTLDGTNRFDTLGAVLEICHNADGVSLVLSSTFAVNNASDMDKAVVLNANGATADWPNKLAVEQSGTDYALADGNTTEFATFADFTSALQQTGAAHEHSWSAWAPDEDYPNDIHVRSCACGATELHSSKYEYLNNGTHRLVCDESDPCNFATSPVSCTLDYQQNADGSTHNVTCSYCEATISSNVTHDYSVDDTCVCGKTRPTLQAFSTLTFPDANKDTNKSSGYSGTNGADKTWEAKTNDTPALTYTIANFNNNSWGPSGSPWTYIKCGRNGNTSTAWISVSPAAKVTAISVVFSTFKKNLVNSVKLYVYSDKGLTNLVGSVDWIGIAASATAQTLTIPHNMRGTNQHYKLVIDCAAGTDNGFVVINSIQLLDIDCGHNYVAGDVVAANCSTDGSEQFTCSICGHTYEVKTAKTGEHTWSAWAADVANPTTLHVRTCSACSTTETHTSKYEYLNNSTHRIICGEEEDTCTFTTTPVACTDSYVALDATNHKVVCAVCSATLVASEAHTFTDGTCTGCGVTEGSAPTPTAQKLVTFELGKNGTATNDGKSATTYSEPNGDYTLSITDGNNMYTGGADESDNHYGGLKLSSGNKDNSPEASFKFAVPADVNMVVIYVAGYNNAEAKIKYAVGSTWSDPIVVTTKSSSGEYTAIYIDTSGTVEVTVTFQTVNGDKKHRARINTIEFWSGDPRSSNTNQSNAKKLNAPSVTLATDGTASWLAVDDAESYAYEIDTNGTITNGIITESPTQTGLSASLEHGQKIRVMAVGNGTTTESSDWSDWLTYTAPTLSAPTGLEISQSGVATWDAVSGAVSYKYKLDDNATEHTTTDTSVTGLEEGQTITVMAVGNGTTTLDSPYCTPVTYTILREAVIRGTGGDRTETLSLNPQDSSEWMATDVSLAADEEVTFKVAGALVTLTGAVTGAGIKNILTNGFTAACSGSYSFYLKLNNNAWSLWVGCDATTALTYEVTTNHSSAAYLMGQFAGFNDSFDSKKGYLMTWDGSQYSLTVHLTAGDVVKVHDMGGNKWCGNVELGSPAITSLAVVAAHLNYDEGDNITVLYTGEYTFYYKPDDNNGNGEIWLIGGDGTTKVNVSTDKHRLVWFNKPTTGDWASVTDVYIHYWQPDTSNQTAWSNCPAMNHIDGTNWYWYEIGTDNYSDWRDNCLFKNEAGNCTVQTGNMGLPATNANKVGIYTA